MGLKICGELCFGHIEDVEKIQLIRIFLSSTSFTKLLAERKLWKFVEKYLLGKSLRKFSWGNDLDRKECPKNMRVIKEIEIALPSQSAILNRIGKWILLNYFWTMEGRVFTYLRNIWSKVFMRIFREFLEWQNSRLLHKLGWGGIEWTHEWHVNIVRTCYDIFIIVVKVMTISSYAVTTFLTHIVVIYM